MLTFSGSKQLTTNNQFCREHQTNILRIYEDLRSVLRIGKYSEKRISPAVEGNENLKKSKNKTKKENSTENMLLIIKD